MIMTERNSLATCHPSDHVASLVAKNVDQFSFVPVVRDGKICGLYNAERWFEEIPPADARVEGDFDALTEDQVIGGEASILEFVLSAISQPARLVVSGGEIVGMVCLADLQKLPVRAALFGLVTALEMVMAERIQATCHEDSGEWLGLLSPGRRRKLKEKVVSLRKSDSFVSEILATEFADKADIIVKLSVLEGSKTKVREQLRDIEKLRNSLAHASPFGTTRDAAEKVPHTVEAISRIIGELRET
ncbi:MAG: hypothetical protein F4229_05750 [Gammaproteobacteria bacterium]|nr:hypothetical protein [Gammaproteobacteria bacterium]MYH16335.1 hypothetical protein [Gammaproteobacteria bacterium]MYK84035.1 hypothetical protein [Gammaproteobacteria bacterium]